MGTGTGVETRGGTIWERDRAGTGVDTRGRTQDGDGDGDLRNDGRGGSEDAREETTPASSQQPQLQDPISQRGRRIMRKARAQGR